jgi:SAM-dependent methyltransferase
MNGWDNPEAPIYYEAFCRRFSRYTRANSVLVSHAHIEPGLRVLDLAAGTGRTAEAVLERLGDEGHIVCVEPSEPMRVEGMRRIRDARVEWCASLQEVNGPFDRIVCGAGIWQIEPLPDMLRELVALLREGGALCFNMPALYLHEPDEAGGGRDPLLLDMPAALAVAASQDPPDIENPRERPAIDKWLRDAGLDFRPWTFRVRLTQDAFAAWLKIPGIAILPGLTPQERAARIDAALGRVDRASWKWERWRGWTAWKP